MITRTALRELASFESTDECATTFYFQPWTPRDQSHRDEVILIKDIVRQSLRRAQRLQHSGPARADVERILNIAESLDGNHSRAKAIFACSSRGIWREFDLPPHLPRTELLVNRRFHLRPLAAIVDQSPRCCLALMDRKRARIFLVWAGEVTAWDDFTDMIPRTKHNYGFAGYNAGHAERHVENHAIRHFQNAAERLLKRFAGGDGFDKLLIGCREEIWAEIEPHIHPYLKQVLVGRFSLDVATATPEQVREAAERLLEESLAHRRQALVREVLGEAQRNARGAMGLRHVVESLERGEVQTLLLGDKLAAAVVECTNCGHLDTRVVKSCAICGRPTRELEDVADALIGLALRNSAEIVYISDDAQFERAGHVGALLRFRADQNTHEKQMAS